MIQKKLIFLALLLGFCSFAQDDNTGGTSGEEKDVNLFSFPVSPEAGRLGTYGNIPVNLSTGQMSFPVPLYSLNLNGYSWPISLSYNFKGLIYEDKPSLTGLGWNLQAGGVVTREVRGIPDEHPKGYYGASGERQRLLDPYFTNGTMTRGIAEELSNGNIDGEADKYYVSVNGVSFSFKIGLDKNPVYLSEHNHLVHLTWKNANELEKFEVTDDNGIQYIFEDEEYNEPTAIGSNWTVFNDSFTKYTSSWHLSKVIFPNLEEITFSYLSSTYYSYDHFASGATNSLQIQCGSPQPTPLSTYNDGFSKTKITRKILSQISSSVANVNLSTPPIQSDGGYQITYNAITVRNNHNNSNLWEYGFTYEGARDLLMSITRNGDHYYNFDYYNKTTVPAFVNSENSNAFKQDLWGFYNGVNNQYGVNIAGTSYEADKRASFAHTRAGALYKITYPTKGYSQIEYEQNTAKTPYDDVLDSGQSFSPNWQIHLEFESDQTPGSGYKERKYTYTFNQTVVADIRHSLTALPASFSGVSITKKDACDVSTNSATSYGDYANHLRAIGNDPIPEFCPRLHDVIDDGDISGSPTTPITKRDSSNGQIKIPAGTYEFKVWTNSNHEPVSGEIKVRFYKPIDNGGTTPEFTNKMVGGIRVHKVTHFTGDNSQTTSKLYEYIDQDGFSSGYEVQKAIWAYNHVIENCCGLLNQFVFKYFNRVNYTSKTYNPINLNQGIPVIYAQVRESSSKQRKVLGSDLSDCNMPGCLRLDPDSNSILTYIGPEQDIYGGGDIVTYDYPNGYTTTYFGGDIIDLSVDYPFVPKGEDKDVGRVVKQDIFSYQERNESYAKVTDETNHYTKIIGSSANPNYPKSVKIAYKIKKEGNCYYYPDNYNVFNYYKLSTYQELDKRHLITEKISKQYFPEEVSTTQNFTYDSKHQLKKSITTNSENQVLETEQLYPYDMSSGGAAEMAAENILTPVVATITKRDGTIIGQSKVDYTEITSQNTNHKIYKPSKKLVASGTEPLRGVTKYDQYDNRGNLLQYFKITKDGITTPGNPNPTLDKGGTIVSAIWGYNYKYPVAQIANASYDEAISHLTVSIDQLQSIDGQQLESQLDNIRQALPNAQVTTYIYNPLIGVTRITDPRGYTMTYEYDDLYRLQYVRDQDGNILSENQYNYRD